MLNKHALWYTSFAAQCQARKQAAYLRAVPGTGGHTARIVEQTGHFAQFPTDLQAIVRAFCARFFRFPDQMSVYTNYY